jgi:PhzF family phenazine biosynthesis protein
MKLKIWQVDAFASKPLEGNPAAVVPLESWLDAGLMQRIAGENNVSETAFFVKTGADAYDLRWFTPALEVDLCGHATLASAWTLFNILDPDLDQVRFMTRSGELVVKRGSDGNVMSLPSAQSEAFAPPAGFADALGKSFNSVAPKEFFLSAKGGAGAKALIAVWETPDQVKALEPSADLKDVAMQVGASAVTATAPGGGQPYDMVSRFFAPYYGVPEDPVTHDKWSSLPWRPVGHVPQRLVFGIHALTGVGIIHDAFVEHGQPVFQIIAQ